MEEAVRDPARFWDKLANKYSKKSVKDIESYNKTLDCIRKRLSASDNVLEVGCNGRKGPGASGGPPYTPSNTIL